MAGRDGLGPGTAELVLVAHGVALLHPEEQVLAAMLHTAAENAAPRAATAGEQRDPAAAPSDTHPAIRPTRARIRPDK